RHRRPRLCFGERNHHDERTGRGFAGVRAGRSRVSRRPRRSGPAVMTYFIEQTVNALSLGGTYALLALGLAVVFSILGMINFAHGALMTLTGYALVFASIVGLPFGLAALFAVFVAIASAVLLELVAFRPVRRASGATM